MLWITQSDHVMEGPQPQSNESGHWAGLEHDMEALVRKPVSNKSPGNNDMNAASTRRLAGAGSTDTKGGGLSAGCS